MLNGPKGGLARVYLGRLESNGEVVVIKSVTTGTSEGMRSMQNEVQYLVCVIVISLEFPILVYIPSFRHSSNVMSDI
jgi:hypothetical protein